MFTEQKPALLVNQVLGALRFGISLLVSICHEPRSKCNEDRLKLRSVV